VCFIYHLGSVSCTCLSSSICSSVNLPVVSLISFHRLLDNERLLLVLADRDKHAIYLESLAGMDGAIQRARPVKTLNRDKMGEEVLFAYDEAKRTLAVCASAKVCAIYILLQCGSLDLLCHPRRCNFTHLCSMRPLGRFKVREVPSIWLCGTAKRMFRSCNCLPYVEATR